jgi:hypothetical protein
VKLAIALDRAVSFKDLAAHPVLADQATLIEQRGVRAAPVHIPSGRCATTATTSARVGEGRR